MQPSHPIALTRQLIESHFPSPLFSHHNTLSPVVTTHQNFDSLGFPHDHPGRSRTDTYYLNSTTCLRTHTSAHESDLYKASLASGYTITADVYRRDAIDRTHYPIFHQMECALTWDRAKVPEGDIARAVLADLATLPNHGLEVEDPNPVVHKDRNPLQPTHKLADVEAIVAHMKRSIENMVVSIFEHARQAALASNDPSLIAATGEPIRMRWVEAYFPFTSPSWELEVLWQGEWLELLGCGIFRQKILDDAGVPNKIAWAFGVGMERLAMLLFGIPDIRLFWSVDERFLSQFKEGEPLRRFIPFSKYPACYKDVAFWMIDRGSAAGGGAGMQGGSVPGFVHENDVMEVVRDVAGDIAEDVRLVDEFQHAKSGRRSRCYRINYRSLERTLTNVETNDLHEKVRSALVERLGVELR